MKISLNWLKDYVSIGVTIDSLVHKLTMAGLEVEKIETIGNDTVLELEITPNRADCLNMVGMAREVGAVLNKTYEFPTIKKTRFPHQHCDIKIENKKDCLRYIGTVLEDVHISTTPQWMQKRLASLSMKSINNIVDVTNFCLWELGQPLHVFDYDKLKGGKVVVRRAKEGERIITLDGIDRKLDPSILVIADAQNPVAIAGIMGGKDTEVDEHTTDILLESAYFDPILIRRSARKLKLSSDSSYRFERGVHFDMVEKGADRALALILQSAQGKIIQRSDICVGKAKVGNSVDISIEKINEYLGTTLTTKECIHILKKLDFHVKVQAKDILRIDPPSFRIDIKEEVDIIEEIARIIGYDQIPSSLPQIKASNIPESPKRAIRKKIKNLLCGQGFNEVITYSMTNQIALDKVKQGNLKGVKIKNPLNQDQELMRPSLLPSFLEVVQTNVNRGMRDLKFFECGKIYSSKDEKEVLGFIMSGTYQKDWREKSCKSDFYDLKGAIEQVFNRLKVKNIHFEDKEIIFLEEGQRAVIFKGNKNIGVIGKVHEEVLDQGSIKEKNIFFAQIDLESVYSESNKSLVYKPIIEFPAMTRDVSLAVKEDIHFDQIKEIAFSLGTKILTQVTFTEQYLGDKLIEGYRGVIFSLKYQSLERTLREEEVNQIHEGIEKAFVDQLGAMRR